MHNKPLLIITCLLITATAHAQDSLPSRDTSARQAMNGWYAELAGSSLIGITFNYERFFSRRPGGLSIHAGAGGIAFSVSGDSGGLIAFPVGMSYNIATSRKFHNFIEIGGGYTFLSGNKSVTGIYYPVLGWRYLMKPKGLQLRATCLPFVDLSGDKIAPWFGFSIGKKFGH
jgi:hypothetical protein